MMTGVQITEAQLLLSGLASGIAIVGVVVKWLITSPEREALAYKHGVTDEQERAEENLAVLRATIEHKDQEITTLRNALLRLAVAVDLTTKQRLDIAQALGYIPTDGDIGE